MQRTISIALSPEQSFYKENHLDIIAKHLRINKNQITYHRLVKKSLDARNRNVVFHHLFEVFIDEKPLFTKKQWQYKEANTNKSVIIVGAGPAGLFAALNLLRHGIKPIILERGKPVEERKHDIAKLVREGFINTNSNYCFGEGGAGTYSDGKLYTRSSKRGDVDEILQVLIDHGADEAIAYEAHAHIGTDKLPNIIRNIRHTILHYGGEFYFNSKVDKLILKNNEIRGVHCTNNSSFMADAVFLCIGHSARDTYEMLSALSVELEPKPFALGVRVEHPQDLINEIQYKKQKNQYLPAATYSLAHQVADRGVFSFCMCPGGIIVPAGTDSGQCVINGMSNSRRNGYFANAGIVVTVGINDFYNGNPLDGLAFQEAIEKKAFEAANNSLAVPAQRLTDFIQNKLTQTTIKTSYHLGTTSAMLSQLMPEIIAKCLKQGFLEFDKKMKGFITEEANLLMVESRTSSPVRIPRDPKTFEHIKIAGLYPVGEGAGYAGGIVSSAIDGVNATKKYIEHKAI